MRPPSGRFVVEHALPGRLRLRMPQEVDVPRLVEELKARAGVTGASGSPVTGGVLVRFDHARVDVEELLEVVAGQSLEAQAAEASPRATTLAEAVATATAALDAKVKHATGQAVGLSSLVSLGLLGWAGSEIARGRARPLAWTSAIWYAHGLLRDYDRDAAREAAPPSPPAP
jgi:hypothetical protein